MALKTFMAPANQSISSYTSNRYPPQLPYPLNQDSLHLPYIQSISPYPLHTPHPPINQYSSSTVPRSRPSPPILTFLSLLLLILILLHVLLLRVQLLALRHLLVDRVHYSNGVIVCSLLLFFVVVFPQHYHVPNTKGILFCKFHFRILSG